MDSPTGYSKRPLWQWVIIYLIIGGLVYAAIYYFYFMKKGTAPYGAAYNPPAITSPTQTTTQPTITITSSGFQPNSLTVKAGETIVWSNQTGDISNVSSAPHPAHTDYPPLNLGDIAPGASVSLTFPTAGTYKYHNHLNATQYGSITVSPPPYSR